MSGTVSLREAALAAVATRLTAALSGVVIERARRSEPDTGSEPLPLLVLTGGGLRADEATEAFRTHYRLELTVSGYAAGGTDLACEQALSHLHARLVDALRGWEPAEPGLSTPEELDADFVLFDADNSAKPAGMFIARFTILAVGPEGGPWST